MNDQPYGDARREFDYFEPRPAAPVPPWNSRAYDQEEQTCESSPAAR